MANLLFLCVSVLIVNYAALNEFGQNCRLYSWSTVVIHKDLKKPKAKYRQVIHLYMLQFLAFFDVCKISCNAHNSHKFLLNNQAMSKEALLDDAVFLIFANKQDLPNAASAAQLVGSVSNQCILRKCLC